METYRGRTKCLPAATAVSTASLGPESNRLFMYSDELSDVLRQELQPMERYRQFCDAKDAAGKGLNKGDKFYWNVYSNVVTQGTDLLEQDVMPETNFTISQNNLTIGEMGNSVPYNGLLDDLSKHPVSEIIHYALKNDANKALDAKAAAQFKLSPLTVTPAGGNSSTAITVETTGTATATNNIALNNTHVKLIVDQMKERDIGVYDGQNYMAVARPSTLRSFKDDLEALHSYVDPGFRMILNGEIGRHYEGVRFFEQTNIASEGWTNSKSDRCDFFGKTLPHASGTVH